MTTRAYVAALLALAMTMVAPATAQQVIPQFGIDSSGSCRNLSVRDVTLPGMVTIACVDTTTHTVKQPSVAITGGTIAGITDLAVADGGTGASTASAARSNLGLGTAATVNTGTSGATVPLLNGSNVWSGSSTFPWIYLNSASGTAAHVEYQTGALVRWRVGKNNTAESTGNAGSDWSINSFDDTGAFLRTNFQITRSNGEGLFNGLLRPGADNVYSLGTAANRWSNVYAVSLLGSNAYLNAAAGSNRQLRYQSNGVARWDILTTATAEGGSDSGSNLAVYRYSDAGAYLSMPLAISRSTGMMTASDGITTANAQITGGAITGITDLAVADGGTGASDAATARTNLGAASSGSNSDITALSGLTTALSIAQGGTGATSDSAARTALGLGTAAVNNIGTSGNTIPKNNTANTWSAAQTFSAGVTVSTRVYYTATVFDAYGAGSPEGVVTAGIGSTYRRTDGGAVTSFYVKESGTGNTGWVAK